MDAKLDDGVTLVWVTVETIRRFDPTYTPGLGGRRIDRAFETRRPPRGRYSHDTIRLSDGRRARFPTLTKTTLDDRAVAAELVLLAPRTVMATQITLAGQTTTVLLVDVDRWQNAERDDCRCSCGRPRGLPRLDLDQARRPARFSWRGVGLLTNPRHHRRHPGSAPAGD